MSYQHTMHNKTLGPRLLGLETLASVVTGEMLFKASISKYPCAKIASLIFRNTLYYFKYGTILLKIT